MDGIPERCPIAATHSPVKFDTRPRRYNDFGEAVAQRWPEV
jgi:hypothetical protein